MSKSPSLRRIQADVRELALDPSDRYYAAPLENDMFEWHFTIRGADGTDFEGGVYHGRILLPPEYPFKPPHIMFLTPSGRFETNTKVCLSFSAFHPELWQPAWGIRLILEALISFLPTPADGAIGALDWSSEERKRLAKASRNFSCPVCCAKGTKCIDLLPTFTEEQKAAQGLKKNKSNGLAKQIEELQRLQKLTEGNKQKKSSETEKESKAEDEKADADACGEDSKPKASAPAATNDAGPSATEKEDAVEGVESASMDDNVAAASPSATPVVETVDDTEEEKPPATPTDTDDPKPAEEIDSAGAIAQPPAAQTEAPPNLEMARAAPEAVAAEGDPSWMYDPLLNLMIVLMAAICYLLIQKFSNLLEELVELEATYGSAN